MLLGIISPPSAGQKTALAYLNQKGYHSFSVNEALKSYLRADGTPPTLEALKDLKKTIKLHPNPDFLDQILPTKIPDKSVICDINDPTILNYIIHHYHPTLLSIDASTEARYHRSKMTETIPDELTLDQFHLLDNEESKNLRQCMAKSNYTIWNNNSIQDFTRQLDSFLMRLKNL